MQQITVRYDDFKSYEKKRSDLIQDRAKKFVQSLRCKVHGKTVKLSFSASMAGVYFATFIPCCAEFGAAVEAAVRRAWTRESQNSGEADK